MTRRRGSASSAGSAGPAGLAGAAVLVAGTRLVGTLLPGTTAVPATAPAEVLRRLVRAGALGAVLRLSRAVEVSARRLHRSRAASRHRGARRSR